MVPSPPSPLATSLAGEGWGRGNAKVLRFVNAPTLTLPRKRGKGTTPRLRVEDVNHVPGHLLPVSANTCSEVRFARGETPGFRSRSIPATVVSRIETNRKPMGLKRFRPRSYRHT